MRIRAAHAVVLFATLAASLASLGQEAAPTMTSALSFEQRVEAQEAIERVFWAKRIWPKDNPGPKPHFETFMSQDEIAAKVRSAMERATALESRLGRPISEADLDAEILRMTANSRDPETLKALKDALHNDLVLLRECLAKPALVDLQEAKDQCLPEAEAEAGALPESPDAPQSTLGVPNSWAATSTAGAAARTEHTAVWTGAEMIVWGGWDGTYSAPNYLRSGGRYTPATDSWAATSTGTNCPTARRYHTAVWTGTWMIIWGGSAGSGNFDTGGRYNPSTNTWSAVSVPVGILGRHGHSAVWTGSEMIIFGGDDSQMSTNGVPWRYNPTTDSWTAGTATVNAPLWHTATWTGSEMVIFGGCLPVWGCVNQNTLMVYSPSAESWRLGSDVNAPSARSGAKGVWTGTEFIVWGGDSGSVVGGKVTGGRYNVAADTWTPTSTVGSPDTYAAGALVWTGSQMMAWGGQVLMFGSYVGGRYSPGNDVWAPMSDTNAPTHRSSHTGCWTGSEMIVHGGAGSVSILATGGRYTPDCTTAPTLTAANGTCTGVLLTWSPGSETFSGYDIYRTLGGACGEPSTRVAQGKTGTLFLDTTAEKGVAYSYKVRGICDPSGLESPSSNCLLGQRIALPATPTNVAATGSCTGVSVSWSSTPASWSYDVARGTACGTALATFSGVTSPYNDTTAVAGTAYQYWVVAHNNCGDIATSACAIGTRTPAPDAPTGVTTAGVCNGITVSWNPSAGATSYVLHRGTTCGTAVTNFTNVSSPYTDTSAVTGTTYQYWVNAVNACGTGSASSCASGTVLVAPTAAAAAPTFTSVGCNTLYVNWTAVPLASQYDVYRVKAATCTGAVKVNASPVTNLYYRDTGLTPSSQYSYYVVASNACGTGPAGTCAQVTTTSAAPAAVTGLTTSSTCAGVTLSWTDSPGATSYTMKRASTCGGTGITNPSVTNPWQDTTAQPGTSYVYWIIAVNSCGSSPASSCSYISMPNPPSWPAAPTASVVSCNSLTLSWPAPSTIGADYYDLYRTTGANCFNGYLVNASPITGTTYTDTGLAPNTVYSYQLYAYNACGSNYGPCANLSTGPPCPAAPTGVSAGGVCGGVTVSWNPSAGATSYTLYRGTACGTALSNFAGVSSPFTDTTASPGTTYQYWVVAFNGASASPASACAAGAALAPAVPTITGPSANTCPSLVVQLSTEPGMASYQWLNNGAPVGGATASTLITSASGTYSVSVVTTGGCAGTSRSLNVNILPCQPPEEVAPGDTVAHAQTWTDRDNQTWSALAGTPTYNLFRGTQADLPNLLTGQINACTRQTGTATTAFLSEDPSSVPGRFYWYLVAASNANGLGPTGNATAGPRLIASSGVCP